MPRATPISDKSQVPAEHQHVADAVLEVSGERQGDSARGRLRIVRAGAEPVVAATPIQPIARMRPLTERLAELSVERLKVGNTIQPSRRPSYASLF